MKTKLDAHSAWLVYSGGDGWHSTVAVGEAQLQRAWLEHHFSLIDFENLDEQHQQSVHFLMDDDNWHHSDDGQAVSLRADYEGDYAGVIRIDDARAISAEVVTEEQIAAGASVIGDNRKPVGRNTAISVFEAMCAAPTTATGSSRSP